jgi:hypothetical protein
VKFLQLISNYESYFANYNERLDRIGATWENAQALYYRDGFLMPHFLSSAFNHLGYEADFIVFNNPTTQAIWANEYSNSKSSDPIEILLEQIECFAPDILYIMDPITLNSSFVRKLARKPSVVIGWRAAPVPSQIDFSAFDFVFSSVPELFEPLRRQGAKSPTFFLPGVDFFFIDGLTTKKKQFDISFSGQYSTHHHIRNKLLLELAKQQLEHQEAFELAYFLACGDLAALPSGVFAHFYPPIWGREMMEMYSATRAAFHVPLDMAHSNSTAMRLFEVASVGTPIFLQRSVNIYGIFAEDEIIRFDSAEDLVSQFLELRRMNGPLESIGSMAKRRCLTDHSNVIRSQQLLQICGEP